MIKVERYKTLPFNSNFINAVQVEGWGKTRFGWYLGYYNGLWHKKESALNSVGQPLVIGTVAVDNEVIGKGERINIPAAEKHLDIKEFTANDVGSGVRKHHIDIYTGEGRAAKTLSYKVTGKHTVCMGIKNPAPVVELVSK